jgi:GNAT superfamily N-acetyltransferase
VDLAFIERIDSTGALVPIPEAERGAVLRQGEPLHREFRPGMAGDYTGHMHQMAGEGAGIMQLVDKGEVCAIAVWRTYLTTYCGRRFEIDDLVTAEGQRSKGYGATLIRALEAKARSLSCDMMMLTSATWRVDAHRFYLRERFAIDAFLFSKTLLASQ